MKRIISVLVVLTMMLTSVLVVMPISAASGTAINTADEFLNMADNGSYYLAKDITITESYSGTFSGTLDGNGKTITLSGAYSAIFMLDGATVKNLTLKGDISKKDIALSYGALAPEAKNCVIDNVDSQVKITLQGEDDNAVFAGAGVGGIIGYARDNVTVKNCDNSGAIAVKTKAARLATSGNQEGEKTGWFGLGGIVGKVDANHTTFVAENCTNSGALSSLQTRTQIGGIVGEVKFAKATIRKCTNSGAISFTQTVWPVAHASYSGVSGILGAIDFAADAKAESYLYIISCNNSGNVTVADVGASSKNVWAAGMLGRGLAPIKVVISNCNNSGNITNPTDSSWSASGGIVGIFMSINMFWTQCKAAPDMKILNCNNTGAISAKKFGGGILGATAQLNHENGKLLIEGCVNGGTVSAGDAGGIAGGFGAGGSEDKLSDGTIKNCKNTVAITANGTHAGGILAWFGNMSDKNFFKIDGCTNGANVSTSGNGAFIGGIAGKLTNGNLFKVTNCASTGAVSGGSGSTAKALIGSGTNVGVTGTTYSQGTDSYGTLDAATATSKVSAAVVKAVDNTELVYLIDYAKSLTSGDYTTDSWGAVSSALTAAESAKSASVQSTIDSAATALDNAIKGLEFAEVDVTELKALIAEAEAISEDEYEFMSYATLVNALNNAKKAAGSSSKSTVDAAVAALQAALDGLVPSGNSGNSGDAGNNGDANNGGANNGASDDAGDAKDDAAAGGDESGEGKKKGCGSSIAATAVVLSTVLALGAGVAFRKKED